MAEDSVVTGPTLAIANKSGIVTGEYRIGNIQQNFPTAESRRANVDESLQAIVGKLDAKNEKFNGMLFVRLGEGDDQFIMFDDSVKTAVSPDNHIDARDSRLIIVRDGFIVISDPGSYQTRESGYEGGYSDNLEQAAHRAIQIKRGTVDLFGVKKPSSPNEISSYDKLQDGSTKLILAGKEFIFDQRGVVQLVDRVERPTPIFRKDTSIYIDDRPSPDLVARIIEANLGRAERQQQMRDQQTSAYAQKVQTDIINRVDSMLK